MSNADIAKREDFGLSKAAGGVPSITTAEGDTDCLGLISR